MAAGEVAVPARALVAACDLFDVGENNVRVALVRLSSQGLVEAAGRGSYRLAEAAEDLAREVASWRTAEGRVRVWKGGYVAVHVGALGRTDRSLIRRRTRALSMLGFAEVERGLHLRPDNLEGGVGGVRARLHAVGMPEGGSVFGASSFPPDVEVQIRHSWDGKLLTLGYKRTRLALEKWLARASELEPDVAARESFLLGGRAIRQIVYDPLLPEPLVDVEERRAFVETTLRMDREGRRIWARFFGADEPKQSPRRDAERLAH